MKIKPVIFLITAAIVCFAAPAAFAQDCNPNILATTPDSRFTDNGDGTVTDLETGLMWKKTHESGTFTWQGALQRAQSVNSGGGFAGYADWRVPNEKELKSIVERKCFDPAINLTTFPGTPSSSFWSSSPNAQFGTYAWVVYFYDGHDGGGDLWSYKDYSCYVRLVRGGQ